MEQFVQQLVAIQRQYGALLGGIFGSLIGVLISGASWIRDAHTIFKRQFESLKERVDAIEAKVTASSSSSAGLTGSESQGLSASNISGVVPNAAVAFFTYTSADVNNVGYHNLRVSASGAVAMGTIGSVRWPSALSKAGCPEITVVYGKNTSAGAAKLQGLVPTFDSLNRCTGYDIDSPIALANTDVIDMGVRVRER